MTVTSLIFLLAISISATYGIDAYWRDFNGTIPNDALIPAEDLLIGQVLPGQGCTHCLLPGTFYPKSQCVITGAGNQQITVTDKRKIKILCTSQPSRFYWEYVNIDSLTADKFTPFVIGGVENGNTLYIGKVFIDNQWKIGKACKQYGGLNLPINGGCCYKAKDFMILGYN